MEVLASVRQQQNNIKWSLNRDCFMHIWNTINLRREKNDERQSSKVLKQKEDRGLGRLKERNGRYETFGLYM